MIARDLYIQHIAPFIDKPVIKVITGVRRSGKSTMMELVQQKLIQQGVAPKTLISINFESLQYYPLRNFQALYAHVIELVQDIPRVYLFFDEIQLVERWEEAINSFLVDCNADIYITGSNSYLLSSELSTLLTGRYVQIKIQPLSYMEMLEFHQDVHHSSSGGAPPTKQAPIWDYIRRGGFPSIHIAEYDETTSYSIIQDIYDSIVFRDVLARYNIRNIELLHRVMWFIIDNVGNTFSAKRVSDYCKSQYRRVDISTIYNYIEALESSFMISRARRYDIQGKELLKTQEKYYLADHGIQHALFGYKNRNISGTLENIVYNELRRRGFSVYIGKLKDKEIDFVAEKQSQKLYVQVTYTMGSPETIEREFSPLLAIDDHYPKYVVSLDEHFSDNIDGVQHIGLADFLSAETW